MRLIADLHIHSRFSRATSGRMDLENLTTWAKMKGIGLLGTGDFTHPDWLAELRMKLEDLGNGLYGFEGVCFMLTTEISNVFTTDEGMKKVHTCLCAPSFEVVDQINDVLAMKGNLKVDGRPVFGMSAAELVEIVMNISKECFVYPAHAWTPWFGVLGSRSGFDSIRDCYEEQVRHIHALETGLSSDPPMNWRVSSLDKYALLSNSDAHSPQKIGREANVFELDRITYDEVIGAIKERDGRFKRTIEFFPQEGKYHWDGHRKCGIKLSPKEAMRYNNICPICRKPLTIGVLHRVEKLADRPEGYVPKDAVPYVHLIPLNEIIGSALGKDPNSKKVMEIYENLVGRFGDEFSVLMDVEGEELFSLVDEKVAEGILKVREGKVKVEAGYDGVYGRIIIYGDDGEKQRRLSEFV